MYRRTTCIRGKHHQKYIKIMLREKLEYSITDETKSSMVATDEVGKESIDASEILERNLVRL